MLAPFLVLGLPYDGAIDVWSIGCTLYELYTGKILFPGRSNNQMLLHMMELKGRFNSKMVKKAKFGDVYFDEVGGFLSLERDKVTGAVCIISFPLPFSDNGRFVYRMSPARCISQSLLAISVHDWHHLLP